MSLVRWINVVIVLLISGSLQAQDPDSSSAIFAVAESERNFSRQSVAVGRVHAFLENLADESVIFQPDPINGRAFYGKRKPTPVLLTWEPEFVDVSASEDLGISTGPWEMADYGPLHRPKRYGYYVSVWKKQSDGAWKVVIDMGNGVEEKSPKPLKFSYPKNSAKKRNFITIDLHIAKGELIRKEVEFEKAYSNGHNTELYQDALTNDARILRMGHFPAVEKDSIRALLQLAKELTWKPIDGDISAAGDLGYTYGTYAMKGEKGHYFHVWRKESTGWQMLIDVQVPVE